MGAYDFATRNFLPHVAYALTLLHRKGEPAEQATPERLAMDKDVDAMRAANNWSAFKGHVGIETCTLVVLISIVPKFGALKMVAIKGPTEATETEYLHSVTLSTAALRQRLARFTPVSTAGSTPAHPSQPSSHPLPNRDLDTGRVVDPGGYPLTDSTYATLLHSLAQTPTQAIPPGIKQDVLAYYSDPNAPITTKKNPSAWAQVQADLAIFASLPTSTEPEPFPTYGQDPEPQP